MRFDKSSGGIQHGLQSVLQVYRGTHKDQVILIQCSDQCQLAGRAEGETVARYGCGAVLQKHAGGVDALGPHGDAGVDVDTKIQGCSDWRHQGITDTNRTSRDLVLTS